MAEGERGKRGTKAYHDPRFINSKEGRAVRLLSEYLEPKARLERHGVEDTIVFMGSARIREPGKARTPAEKETAVYYEAARSLAFRLTEWSKGLDPEGRRFVVCTGGGPGIMEAANRGASEARGMNMGLTISIPVEEFDNPYITRDLALHFHYFFMRKFWFVYLAKAVIVFPGGFGTLDELFEILTLVQTRKVTKRLPVVLFGTKFWKQVINFDALVKHGTISPPDVNLMYRTDSVDEAYAWIVGQLSEHAIQKPGATL